VNTAPGTEVGRVTDAVNNMLAHVESALAERQQTETLLRQFVADASHELRTPLAIIRSHAEYAQMAGRELSPDVAEALSRINAESTRMGALVSDLLTLARLDSGRPLQFESVDLTRIVLDAALDARALDAEHDWQLDLPEREVTIDGDRNALHQVVVNLFANAVEHTPAGTRTTVALTLQGNEARLVVTDDGPGIEPHFLPHIFKRFVRADSARDHTSGESGLGLAIVDAIVGAHGGTISVTSEPGSTRFIVTLPIRHRMPSAENHDLSVGS
jgi:two-component system OmpR family sensor kinase